MLRDDNTLVIKTVKEMRKIRKELQDSVGFIPTMGYLHDGHLSLVKKAKKENNSVIVSIFINEKQFNQPSDYQKYPQDLKRDLALLQNSGVDYVFLPNTEEMYPEHYLTYIEVKELTDYLEGKSRPGHFKGVTTVVAKLFNLIQPTRAYFGQKDAQQVAVVKKMVADLNFPLEIIVGETVREPDGLAMSSRNVFLTKKQRKEAVILFKSLLLAQELFLEGQRDSKIIKNKMKQLIQTTVGVIDYISIADTKTLQEVTKIEKKAIASLATYFGETRLIDNIVLEEDNKGSM